MIANEKLDQGSEPAMNLLAQLGLRKAFVKLVEERSRVGGKLLVRRNGTLTEVPALDLLSEARRQLEEVNAQLNGAGHNHSQ
jgi:hypothetical protein